MTEQDLSASYALYENRSGYGERPALVLVDFAKAYFDPDCDLYAGVDDALASALRVRAAARAAGVPVVLTEVVYHESGVNGGRFWQKAKPLRAFVKGRRTAEFADGLVPEADELVVSKQYPSAFFGTSLASTLTAAGVDSVILTGLTTSGCVRASCVDSMSHGFATIVVREACGDRHPGPHEANLFDMNAKYADVVSEAEILAYLGTCRDGVAA
ncbi:MAG: isochorismatase family protein [Pseudomonadota bacterium]|nr:isochorismatase family protein [Pseudomonadota bacterium]